MRSFFCLTISLICFLPAFTQVDSSRLVKYTPEFKFKEGIYLNFEQLKNNSPLPKSRIVTTADYDDPEFFDIVLNKSVLYYYDDLGNSSELKVKNIWGYSRNGFIYVKKDENYFRITLIGSISHFIADVTVYNYNNPYNYNYYYDPYRIGPTSTASNEMRQYLLDFNSGRIFDYNDAVLEALLMQDPELHDEYSSLSKKKKKQLKFMYVRKFNEKNPLYFPQN